MKLSRVGLDVYILMEGLMKGIIKKSAILAAFIFATSLSIDSNAQEVVVNNISGSDRFSTAASISKSGWKDGSENVIIVNSNSVADSLSVAPLSNALKAPVLLTESNILDANNTKPELDRLKAKNIILIGGENSISSSVEETLKTEGYSVERITGSTRNETSLNIAKKLKTLVSSNFSEAYIVNGTKGLADAAGVGSIAAKNNAPILFSDKNYSESLKNELDSFGVGKIYIIGGENNLDSGFDTITSSVERIYGKDRQETNNNLINKFYSSFDTVYIADDGSKNSSKLIDSVLINAGIIASSGQGNSSLKGGPVMLLNSDYGFKYGQLELLKNNSNTITSLVQVSGGDSVGKPVTRISTLLSDSTAYGRETLEKILGYKNIEIEYVVEGSSTKLTGDRILPIMSYDATKSSDIGFDANAIKLFLSNIKVSGKSIYSEGAYAYWKGNNVVVSSEASINIDLNKESAKLIDMLKAGKSVYGVKPDYTTAKIPSGAKNIGKKYIVINIKNQNMKLYLDGKEALSTPVVTGNPNKGSATPPGIFKITYKTRNAVLRGPGYASPVKYWMPFNGSIGIHDAYWQPFFGGNRYLYAGSHGCVNTPLKNVAYIYSNVEKGTPVIVVRQ